MRSGRIRRSTGTPARCVRLAQVVRSLLHAASITLLAFGLSARSEALELTASHVNPPGEPTFEAFDYLAKRLAQRGSGVRLRAFPRGQLGDEKDIIEQVRLGALSMASISTAALSAFAPSAGVFDIPFLLRDHDRHPWIVADSAIGKRVAAQIERETGLAVLGWWSAGMRHVFTRAIDVRGAADLGGLKIRVIGSPVYMDTFNQLGAKSTPMPYGELYTALATGTVDAAENDTTGYRNMKFYEQAPHLSLTGHFFMFKVIIANRRLLARMTPEQRSAFDQALAEATRFQRDLAASKFESDLAWLAKSAKVTITTPDRASLEAAVRAVQETYAKRFGPALVEAIRSAR
ncbi:MAG TPA: TRAP transporter substrate-binding protein [Burkholderiales bacterium]|nr:TRAP transporter substrate-binding protein [Burkholderiales bacterium]